MSRPSNLVAIIRTPKLFHTDTSACQFNELTILFEFRRTQTPKTFNLQQNNYVKKLQIRTFKNPDIDQMFVLDKEQLTENQTGSIGQSCDRKYKFGAVNMGYHLENKEGSW